MPLLKENKLLFPVFSNLTEKKLIILSIRGNNV